MKIVRNKGGYVIRVTNNEMSVLRHIHDEGYMGSPISTRMDAAAALRARKRAS